MNSNAPTEHRVKEFVSRCRCHSLDRTYLDTDLWGDLGVAGDEVDDFFEEFCEEFDVPIERIDVSGCFPSEGQVGCLYFLARKAIFKPTRRCRIEHLIGAAKTKQWPPLEEIYDDSRNGEWRSEPEEDPLEALTNFTAKQQRRLSPSRAFVLMMWLISIAIAIFAIALSVWIPT
jgi:hypothetical protein